MASIVVSIVVGSVVKDSVVVVGCELGFLKGLLLPPKGLLLLPCCLLVPSGLCLLPNQRSGAPPDPDDTASSVFSLDGGWMVGGEGKVCDSVGVSAVVEDVME